MGKPEGKRPLGRPMPRRKMILTRIFKRWDEGHRMDWSRSGQGRVAGPCEYKN